MKIGIFTDTYYPDTNGVGLVTKNLKFHLERLGHTVYVVTPNNKLKTKFDSDNNILYTSGIVMKRWSDISASFRFSSSILEIIKSWKLDIVHVQSEYAVGIYALKVAKKLNLPLLYNFHTFWEFYVDKSNVPAWWKKVLVKIVYGTMEKFIESANLIVTPTDKSLLYLSNRFSITKDIKILPNAIDYRYFHDVSEVDSALINKIKNRYNSENYFLLGNVGRVVNEKRSYELVLFCEKLIQEFDRVKILFIGDGPLMKKCGEYIYKQQLNDKIIMPGRVVPKVVKHYYHAFDLFTANSDTETQGLTYAEAAACNKPELVRYDKILEKIVAPGKNGYFFDNLDSFLVNFKKLYQIYNTPKWKDFQEHSFQLAQNHNLKDYAFQMLKFYFMAIEKHKKANKN